MAALKRRLKLHHLILGAMILGALAGVPLEGRGRGDFWYDLIDTVGALFLNLLKAVMVPLVVASLTMGMLSVGDPRKLGRIGVRTLGFYLATTVIAILVGLLCVNAVRPDRWVDEATRTRLLDENRAEYAEKAAHFEAARRFTAWDFVKGLVPTNPFAAMAQDPPQMLPLILFTLLVGLSASLLGSETRKPFQDFMGSLNEVMLQLVRIVMVAAPAGAFALIAKVVMKTGIGILGTLLAYVATMLLAYVVHFFGTYGLAIRLLARESPWRVFGELREVFLTAFSTSSSAATIPVTLKAIRERLAVPAPVANFCVPLGATMNMDGTSIMQAVASVFIARVYLGDLSLGAQASILLTATLASIGTAPIPAAGIVMLAVILVPIGVPLEGIALILGVDRVLDMARTVLNVTGDVTCAVIVAKSEEGRA
jgi:Na+/H+-dicarboxylate symporter